MKKLLFLAVLLGLTGCGETDQNDTSQSTLQSSPASFNYYKAATANTMSAPVASFGQWVINGYASEGASTVVNASRTIGGVATESKALITPNVSQVSKILRAGLGGAALTFAVNELLDGIDWVMDPANNQIRYKVPDISQSTIPQVYAIASMYPFDLKKGGKYEYAYSITPQGACNFALLTYPQLSSYEVRFVELDGYAGGCFHVGAGLTQHVYRLDNPNFGDSVDTEKTLPLDVVSQKVIDNAQSGNTDAQAVTFATAQAIVSEAENDATKAKEIEDEFERNADPKCSRHNAYMNGQASIIELRYNELKVDKLFLYRDYFKISTPHPSGYGSWEGHVQRYKFEQGVLKNLIVSAFLDGCPETIKAREWKDKPAPSKPDYAM